MGLMLDDAVTCVCWMMAPAEPWMDETDALIYTVHTVSNYSIQGICKNPSVKS